MEDFINGLIDEMDRLKATMRQFDVDSKEYAVAMDKLTALSKVTIEGSAKLNSILVDAERNDLEERKLELEEKRLEIEQMKVELESRKADVDWDKYELDMKRKRKELVIQVVIDGMRIILPLSAYIYLIIKGFRFEETGSIRSTPMRNLFQRAPKI